MLICSGHPLQLNFPFLERLKLKTIMYVLFPTMLMIDTSPIKSTPQRTYPGARNMIYEYVTYPCTLQKNLSLGMTPISSHKHYLNSSTRETTPSSFTATKANTDGSTTHLSELTSSGVVVGCLRKLQGWSLASIFNEYDRYAQGKGESDLQVPPR